MKLINENMCGRVPVYVKGSALNRNVELYV